MERDTRAGKERGSGAGTPCAALPAACLTPHPLPKVHYVTHAAATAGHRCRCHLQVARDGMMVACELRPRFWTRCARFSTQLYIIHARNAVSLGSNPGTR